MKEKQSSCVLLNKGATENALENNYEIEMKS
jgi:hypothetical protein